MIKIFLLKKRPYLNGPYGPYIKYNGPYSGPYAVPTVPTTETGRNELCALVTTAHLHCMRTGKCHLNLAYLGSGVCVKNAHHMFCVTSHVLCSPSSLPITPLPQICRVVESHLVSASGPSTLRNGGRGGVRGQLQLC